MRVVQFKYAVLALAVFTLLCISLGKCQDDEEDDEEYEEDTVDDATTSTTRRYRLRSSSTTSASVGSETTQTPKPATLGRNDTSGDGNSTQKAVTPSAPATNSSGIATSSGSVPVPAAVPAAAVPVAASVTPAAAPTVPPTPAPTIHPTQATRATTPADSEEEIESTTEEEGLGYIFRPLNNLIDNIVAGNVTGIVDNALSIRTPPEVRSFVNHVMHNVFGVGIGSAFKQFMPSLFSPQGTQEPEIVGRDPIPTQNPPPAAPPAPAQVPIAIPLQAIIDARSNATEDGKATKSQHSPLQLKLSHPGAPASRLRCEVIAE